MSALPEAQHSASGDGREPGQTLLSRHRNRHPPARHGRRADPHLGRLPDLRPDHHRRRRLPHAAQSLEPAGPDLGDRGDEHRHGAHHRHAPYRPLRRLDAELHRRRHRRRASLLALALARLGQSDHLDHRRHRRAGRGRAARRVQRLPGRLRGHPLVHRHARRPHRLQRRGLVGDPRRDGRADGRQFRADRRHAVAGRGSAGRRAGCSARSFAWRSSSASSPTVRRARASNSRSGRSGRRCSSSSSAARSRSGSVAVVNAYPWPTKVAENYANDHNISRRRRGGPVLRARLRLSRC